MIRLDILERLLKFLSSFVYRIIIITYGVLLNYMYGLKFAVYYYLVAAIVYTASFLYLFLKQHRFNYLRLLLDYSFICFMAYGKPLETIPLILYILLPVINSPNHTGNKRNCSLYIYTLAVVVFLGGFTAGYQALVPILAYAVIGWFEFTRSRINALTAELTNVLDDSYYRNLQVGKTHRIYKDLIQKINSSKLATYSRILNIYCLVLKSGNLQIVNSSNYIYSIEVGGKDEFLAEISKREVVSNAKIKIDGQEIRKSTCLRIGFEEKEYIYIFHLDDKSWWLITYIISQYILKVVFIRVVMVFEIEYQIKEMKKSYFENFKSHVSYFESAIDAMHFLKNKFSPLKALLQLYDKYNESTSIEERKELLSLLLFTHERAKQSFSAIENRATMLLENKNTILYREVKPYGIKKLFSMIRTNWGEYFDRENFDIQWGTEIENKRTLLNEDGIYYVVTNILDNMKKYAHLHKKITFRHSSRKFTITFENDFKSNMNQVQQLCKEFMSDDTQEIALRKTHGLASIKKILNQMSVQYELSSSDNKLYFELSFYEVDNEKAFDI